MRLFMEDHDEGLVYMIRHEPYPHRCEDPQEVADYLLSLYEEAGDDRRP